MIGIKMNMPKNCRECQIERPVPMSTSTVCQFTKITTNEVRGAIREKHCPLCELPEDDKISVGDEVITSYGARVVVLGIDSYDDSLFTVCSDGSCGKHDVKDFAKTGRHFNEVEILLKKMRGKDDD